MIERERERKERERERDKERKRERESWVDKKRGREEGEIEGHN